MGMGYAAAFADVIEIDKLEKMFPKEFENLKNVLGGENASDSLSDFAQSIQNDDADADEDNLAALKPLEDAFAARFPGLTLNLGFHDAENGDRYDDIEGPFFSIDGLYVLSPAAKVLGEGNFERKFFVNFG